MIRSILIINIFLLSGCASVNKYLGWAENFSYIKDTIIGFEPEEVDIDYYNSYKSSFATFKFGKGPESILILRSFSDESVAKWVSADGINIYTKYGKIIKTEGLEYDVQYIQKMNIAQFFNPKFIGKFKRNKLNSTPLEYIHIRNTQPIQGVKETYILEVPDLKFSAKNFFIKNEKGITINAIQSIHPFYPEIHMRFFYIY